MIPHKKPFGFGLMDVAGREEGVVFQVGLGFFWREGDCGFGFLGFFFGGGGFLVGFLKHPLIPRSTWIIDNHAKNNCP